MNCAIPLKAFWRALDDPSELRIVDEKRDQPVLVSEPVRIGIKLCLVTSQRRAEVAGTRPAIRLVPSGPLAH